jgi:CHASE2 domain-containing sensor protein
MDLVTSSEGDWAQIKEFEKNERYGIHIYFINYLSALHGRPWNFTQANFTVGARGSLKKIQFQDRLCLLGVTNSKARDKIRVLTVSKH